MEKNSLKYTSFRDPDGFVYREGDLVYRKITLSGLPGYQKGKSSGLFQALVKSGKILDHREFDATEVDLTILPVQIPLISFPYEWSFSMLKDAAILTLEIQLEAMRSGLSLKDASAFNIQFLLGKPVHIDLTSFEPLPAEKPWVAYSQFMRHFVFPLVLRKYCGPHLSRLQSIYLDGIPARLISTLLPWYTRLIPGTLFHVHLPAMAEKKYSKENPTVSHRKISVEGLTGLIKMLLGFVKSLQWSHGQTEWGDYYDHTNYSSSSLIFKEKAVGEMIRTVNPKSLLDIGANDGTFSRFAPEGCLVVAADSDETAVEKHYLSLKKEQGKNILPLVMDFTNPSAGIGWMNREREPFFSRGKSDLVMGLALVHHLAISHHIPFLRMAEGFRELGNHCLIEFPMPEDSQVGFLVRNRRSGVDFYTRENFLSGFSVFFNLEKSIPIEGASRELFLFSGK